MFAVHRIGARTRLTRRFLFTEVVQALPSTTGLIQEGLLMMKTNTGMGWVGTFAFSTVLVRASLLPLVRFQILESQKLAKAMPELNFLVQLLRERLNTTSGDGLSAKRREEVQKTLSIFNKGVNACLKLNDVSLLRIMAPPLVNVGMFITFVVSVREMIRGGSIPDMDSGGLWWFEDLTVSDNTMLLPLIAVSTSYTALELGFHSRGGGSDEGEGAHKGGGRMLVTIKDILQTVLCMSVPVVTQLPAGIFAYWIPSSLAGMVQTFVVRQYISPAPSANLKQAPAIEKKHS